jgi:hypothetical protein
MACIFSIAVPHHGKPWPAFGVKACNTPIVSGKRRIPGRTKALPGAALLITERLGPDHRRIGQVGSTRNAPRSSDGAWTGRVMTETTQPGAARAALSPTPAFRAARGKAGSPLPGERHLLHRSRPADPLRAPFTQWQIGPIPACPHPDRQARRRGASWRISVGCGLGRQPAPHEPQPEAPAGHQHQGHPDPQRLETQALPAPQRHTLHRHRTPG